MTDAVTASGRQIEKSITTVRERKNTQRNQISMRNPKRQKVEEEAANWSKLCRDLLLMVLERLSPTDFHRAKAVCSAWRSASRESVRKQNRIPWLILFPYERSYGYSCRMLNPAEKGLVYRSRNLGVEFTQSRCLATSGSWLLMYVYHQPKLYILNPLTRERISLPPLESRKNDIIINHLPTRFIFYEGRFTIKKRRSSYREDWRLLSYGTAVVLWVDERSKDFIVFWSHNQCCLFFSKKGYDFWRMFPYVGSGGLLDLVFIDHRLYIYTLVFFIEIYGFSGDSPVVVTPLPHGYNLPRSFSNICAERIAVTTSGEVLMVRCYDINTTSSCSFYIYKMNHVTKTWDHMPSLGDRALIFDLGTIVSAKDIQGIKPDSIYFSGCGYGTKHIFIFNLTTRKVEPFMSSTSKFFDARWFIPNV